MVGFSLMNSSSLRRSVRPAEGHDHHARHEWHDRQPADQSVMDRERGEGGSDEQPGRREEAALRHDAEAVRVGVGEEEQHEWAELERELDERWELVRSGCHGVADTRTARGAHRSRPAIARAKERASKGWRSSTPSPTPM
jgi:hypothetical protein